MIFQNLRITLLKFKCIIFQMKQKRELLKLKNWSALSKELKGFIVMRQWVREELADIRGMELINMQNELINNYNCLTNIISSHDMHDKYIPDYILEMSKPMLDMQLNHYGIDPQNFL